MRIGIMPVHYRLGVGRQSTLELDGLCSEKARAMMESLERELRY